MSPAGVISWLYSYTAAPTRLASNKIVNIPWVPESIEQQVLEHAIGLVCDVLTDLLPDPIKDMIDDVSDGISQDEVDAFIIRLVTVVNKRVNIPYLNEDQEHAIINSVITTIVNALVLGNSIDPIDTEE